MPLAKSEKEAGDRRSPQVTPELPSLRPALPLPPAHRRWTAPLRGTAHSWIVPSLWGIKK